MKGQRLHVVDKFIHLASTLSRAVEVFMDYMEVFMIKVDQTYTDLEVYRSLLLPTLLYTFGQFTNGLLKDCLRKLLKITLQDRIQDTDILKRAGM